MTMFPMEPIRPPGPTNKKYKAIAGIGVQNRKASYSTAQAIKKLNELLRKKVFA